MNLRDQMLSIRTEHGYLTPALVVDVARPENHPLHTRFEWDDTVAGEAWRRRQAHQLIRSVRVTYRPASDTNDEASVRAFHAVRHEGNGDFNYAYEPAEDVAQDPFMRELVLRDMQRDWQQLKRRYGHFAEFVDLVLASLNDEAA